MSGLCNNTRSKNSSKTLVIDCGLVRNKVGADTKRLAALRISWTGDRVWGAGEVNKQFTAR